MHHKRFWTAEKIAQRLLLIEPLVYRHRQPIPPFHYKALAGPLETAPTGTGVDDMNWEVIKPNTYWGQWTTDFAMRTRFQIPPYWNSNVPVALYLPLGVAGDFSHPEALVYIDGKAYGTSDRHHEEVMLPDALRDGQEHLLTLHGWTGLGGWEGAKPGSQILMGSCALVQVDQPTRDFIATSRVALGVANAVDANEPAKGHLLNALDDAFKILDTREPFGDSFYASVGPAHAALCAGIKKAGPPLDVTVIATGHAHLDVAWLWTVGEIRRKSGRSFMNVLRLMEQFPEYHFTQSQPQLYDFVRQDYPELFASIKQRVTEGRWEPIGGMWVEADCNLSGAESLARQFLLGRSFFREQFGAGAESPVLWLPDVFGYAWALPQLIKQAGLEYFFTIKIGWSQYNRLPYDTFWWQGLDGTRVLTHFSTTPESGGYGSSTYNAAATPAQNLGTWTNFQQKELEQTLLMAFGYGDGGGGPTREMLENIREMAAFPATPQMRQKDVGDFFRQVESESGTQLPVWNGELYLELHRGTYTSQSRNKRGNRKSEFLLHDAEFVAALAAVVNPQYQYPSATFRRAWELVCINQFHDIVPGSSINQVYVESQQQYAEISQMATAARDDALAAISDALKGGKEHVANSQILIVNPTGFVCSDLALWSGQLSLGQLIQNAKGAPVSIQAAADGFLIAAGELAPFSITLLTIANGQSAPVDTGLTAAPNLLENQYLRVELDDAGDITRIYDKANEREVLAAGAIANQFLAFEDRPMFWDAWDVDIFYSDKMWISDPATSIKVLEAGPLRATLEIHRRILHSEYVQRISLAYNQCQLEFDTDINWIERHILLKVAFPVDILAPTATYEIQWGNVERVTHHNTSWDWARFETCAQKWVDLSEGDYGVSLLNDCKYGHDIRDNVIRLSLLRSPTMPDPEADQGEHRFAYRLLPHAGTWNETTIAAAYALNDPLVVYAAAQAQDSSSTNRGSALLESSLMRCDASNIVVETVKQAEDGNGIIVRLYESQRRRGAIKLTASFPLASAWQTNLLEDNQTELTVEGNSVKLTAHPYQIMTLRLVPAQG